MIKEIWRVIEDYEDYEVSNLGRVRRSNKILKNRVSGKGYLSICTSVNSSTKNHYVHRLVANAFLQKENEYQVVNHKDGNKKNNVVDNLEYVSQSENIIHSYVIGLREHKNILPKGLTKHKEKYMVRISRHNKTMYVGMYNTIELATEAYYKAIKNYETTNRR